MLRKMRPSFITASLSLLIDYSGALAISQKPLNLQIPESTYEIEAPGIGFDLSSTYGTVSIKYKNGTVIDAGKVQGDWDYNYLLIELSKEGTPFQPPFDNSFDQLKWEQQQLERKYRKLRGLPATEDIGTLSTMISSLQYAAQALLAQDVTQAAVTIPHLPMLLRGDLEEAFNYAGMKKIQLEYWAELDEVLASRIGMGYGLCSDPDDRQGCQDEEYDMPQKQAVAISFTNDSLTVTDVTIVAGHYMYPMFRQKNRYLGFELAGRFPDYWDDVGAEIKASAGFLKGRIDEIILYGEAAEEKKFLDQVWKALGDLQDMDLLNGRAADLYSSIQIPEFSALYIGARGAAELARRQQGWSNNRIDDGSMFKETMPIDDDSSVPDSYIQEPLSDVEEDLDPYNISLNMVSWGIRDKFGRQASGVEYQVIKGIGLDLEVVEQAKAIAQNISGNKPWQIEAVDIGGQERELWVIVGAVRECVLVLDTRSKVAIKDELDTTINTNIIAWGRMIVDVSTLTELNIKLEAVQEIESNAKRVAEQQPWWIEVVDGLDGGRQFWTIINGSLAFIHDETCESTPCLKGDFIVGDNISVKGTREETV